MSSETPSALRLLWMAQMRMHFEAVWDTSPSTRKTFMWNDDMMMMMMGFFVVFRLKWTPVVKSFHQAMILRV